MKLTFNIRLTMERRDRTYVLIFFRIVCLYLAH